MKIIRLVIWLSMCCLLVPLSVRADGTYDATVTTESGTYSVQVEVEGGAVTIVHWPNGGDMTVTGGEITDGSASGYNSKGDWINIDVEDYENEEEAVEE